MNRAAIHTWSAMILIAVSGLLRLLWSGAVELAPDEAYYWTWSQIPDWGYFDHPPLLAWLIRGSTALLGDHEVAVRLPTVILGSLTQGLLFIAARDLWAGPRWGLVAVIMANATVLFSAGSSLATPDAPLIFFWLLALYVGARALDSGRLLHWLAAGAAVGLALQAKYSAALLPLCALLYLISSGQRLRQLKRPGPYLAAGLALLIFLPNLLWNWSFGFVSIGFQLEHAVRGPGHGVLANLGEFLGGQAMLVNPVFFIGCLLTLRGSRGAEGREQESRVLLRYFFLVPLLVFIAAGLARKLEANWPAVIWPAGFLALVGLYRERVIDTESGRGRRWRGFAWLGVAMGATMAITAHLHSAWPFLPTPTRQDPTARLRGWQGLAAAVAVERRRLGAQLPLYTRRYQEAAELGFYDHRHPPARAFGPGWRRSQYNLWPDRSAHTDAALILWESDLEVPADLAPADRLQPVTTVRRLDQGTMLGLYVIYLRRAAGTGPSPSPGAPPEAPPAPAADPPAAGSG